MWCRQDGSWGVKCKLTWVKLQSPHVTGIRLIGRGRKQATVTHLELISHGLPTFSASYALLPSERGHVAARCLFNLIKAIPPTRTSPISRKIKNFRSVTSLSGLCLGFCSFLSFPLHTQSGKIPKLTLSLCLCPRPTLPSPCRNSQAARHLIRSKIPSLTSPKFSRAPNQPSTLNSSPKSRKCSVPSKAAGKTRSPTGKVCSRFSGQQEDKN